MFTGIVEETGIIKGFTKNSGSAEIIIGCKKVLENTEIGDSIAINGCCQTVVNIGTDFFKAEMSRETLDITNFSEAVSGSAVNLERAVTPSTRLGGHIVQGHIDGIGHLVKLEKYEDFYNLYFEISPKEAKYIVYKGSVAVNGVSLTVAEANDNIFKTAVIPHTMQNTTLRFLKKGDSVNIETDILGRYVEKFLSVNNNNSTINEKFLMENGFI